ncbi:MAG: polyprenyl synthetase family protein [Planctomycetaceae bacterium]
MPSGPTPAASFPALRDRLGEELDRALATASAELAAIDPSAGWLVEELRRLLDAGGKRLRPVFCVWGHLAAGGQDDDRIVRAAAAFELLHTMALIHDDVMDRSPTRRDVASTYAHLSAQAASRGVADPERAGIAEAVLAGDVAAVLADRLLLTSGFPPERLVRALDRYQRVQLEMAVGQSLDLRAHDADTRRVAHLKGGSYTVTGPLLVGATLAGAGAEVLETLVRFGDPLGQAFQLLDDIRDGEAAPGVSPEDTHGLVERARAALGAPPLTDAGARALGALADLVAG